MRYRSFAVAVLFFCATGAWAQITSGRLSGTVIDPQGAFVAGARVSVANQLQSGRVFETAANERGEWVIPSLPTGIYRVSVTSPGFKTAVEIGRAHV